MEDRNNGPGTNGGVNGAGTGTAAMNDLRDQIEGYREQAQEVAGRVQDWIVENPGYAVLGAAAVGFFVARFVARKRG
jgi:ElaB/YqjD/DUF883 family membrane-anchored ribosome-binding protein